MTSNGEEIDIAGEAYGTLSVQRWMWQPTSNCACTAS